MAISPEAPVAEPVELPIEVEHLLIDLVVSERILAKHRKALAEREEEIAAPFVTEVKRLAASPAPIHEAKAFARAQGEKLSSLRRTTYRSELANLAADVVREERRRAVILRKLDAFPQLGEVVPAIDIAVEHDGERGFIIRTGGGRVYRFSLPIILDRGVWREEARYERGDAVTSDGSLWIARRDDPSHEPGKGDAWRLAVTRGRHGRDATRMRTPT